MNELKAKRSGKFYPFSIEPMPTERERLAKPMTPEDRALRKQWLEDQKLSPREPVDIPEFTRKNIFRRAYAKFFDGFAGIFKPVLGPRGTATLRLALPRVLFPYLALCYLWYQLKYSPRVCDSILHVSVFSNRFGMTTEVCIIQKLHGQQFSL